jgi:hypothetical protein
MDSLEKLKLAIIAQVKANVPVQAIWAECSSANMEAGTMVATRDGLEYDDVLLGLGPDITVPETGSRVLLGIIENKREATFLIYAERVALRRLNGDVFGGLVKADAVTQELNALKQDINVLKAVMAAWVVVPADGGAVLKAASATWAADVHTPTISSTLQNLIVTHG